MSTTPTDCPVCDKHRGIGPLVGPVVHRDDLVIVSHAAPGPDGRAALGHLLVEPLRHAPYLDDLTDDEAAALGRAVSRTAGALRAELRPAFVFSAVVGTGVAHVHQHLFVRAAGTPDDVPWHASDDWPGAPRADADAVAALCAGLAARLAD